MSERGVTVDHTTLYRWVQRYAPIMEKRIRWYQRYTSPSWRVDETHIKFVGEWAYLYRALDADGRPIRRSRARPGKLGGAVLCRHGRKPLRAFSDWQSPQPNADNAGRIAGECSGLMGC